MKRSATNRGRYSLFTPSMHQQAVSHFELVQELRRALQTGDLSMHYQPIVDLDSTDVVGFEALMRWQHPERGWVPTELLHPPGRTERPHLGARATSRSPRPSRRPATGGATETDGDLPYVTVNLSAHQFHDPGARRHDREPRSRRADSRPSASSSRSPRARCWSTSPRR